MAFWNPTAEKIPEANNRIPVVGTTVLLALSICRMRTYVRIRVPLDCRLTTLLWKCGVLIFVIRRHGLYFGQVDL